MLTQALPRRDPRFQSALARAAVQAELEALREEGTWDKSDVYEFEDAKQEFLDGRFSGIDVIVGITFYESDQSEHVYKGRIVLREVTSRMGAGRCSKNSA